MTLAIETQSLPNLLSRLMDTCDDDGWKLSIASQAMSDARLQGALASLAEQRHEMALDLGELAVATSGSPSLLCGRMEAVFERNQAQARELASCPNDAMLLRECVRMEIGVIERYQAVAREPFLPAALTEILQRHLVAFDEGRAILQELAAELAPRDRFSSLMQ